MVKNIRGMTLIEVILFVVIVGVGLAGLSVVFTTTQKSSADPLVRKQALTAAEQMMEEILLMGYTSTACTVSKPCTANTPRERQNYNGVDHYNGWRQCGVLRVLDAPGTLPPSASTAWTQCRVDQGLDPTVAAAAARWPDFAALLMPGLGHIVVEVTVAGAAAVNGVNMKAITVRAVDNDGRPLANNERTITLTAHKGEPPP